MRDPFALDENFRRLIQGDESVDLVRINLEIARDVHPDLEIDGVLDQIESLAHRVRERCSPDGGARYLVGQINWVLFVEEGFRGNLDDYYNPANSYLNEVLETRLGLPITLSVLYQRIGSMIGLPLDFLNLPHHFALKLSAFDEPLIIDPFHEGRWLDVPTCERFLSDLTGRPVRLDPELLRPCQPSVTVARMLRNLKGLYLERKDFASALPVVRRLAALRSHDPIELRDWGMLSLHVDRPGEAVEPLQRYLEAAPEAPDASAIGSLLKTARREVALRN